METKNYEKIISDAENTIKIDSYDRHSYYECGLAYFKIGNYKKAIDYFISLIGLWCGSEGNGLRIFNSCENFIGYGFGNDCSRKCDSCPNGGYFSWYDFDSTIEDLTKDIEKNPNNAENYNLRGQSYFAEYGNKIRDFFELKKRTSKFDK